MLILAIFLATQIISSEAGLRRESVAYLDHKSRVFFVVRSGRYYIGNPLSEKGGVKIKPFDGEVVDCSTATLKCMDIGIANLIVPFDALQRDASFRGYDFSIRKLDGGSTIITSKCNNNSSCDVSSFSVQGTVESYCYEIDSQSHIVNLRVRFKKGLGLASNPLNLSVIPGKGVKL